MNNIHDKVFTCPKCTNKTLYPVNGYENVVGIGFHEICICDECAAELWSEPQCDNTVKFIDIPEKKKFFEGISTFVASVLPELKAYLRFVNRLIGDGYSTVEDSQFQSNCEEVVKVYKYAFETESDEYYERFEISRELKQKCIAASNGHKYY